MTLAGVEYPDKDIDFTNVICDLEDMGYNVMGMLSDTEELNKHMFSFCRAIVSVYTGVKDERECGRILTKHFQMGGKLDDVVNAFSDSMHRAGFGTADEPNQTVTPQDHKKKAAKKDEE